MLTCSHQVDYSVTSIAAPKVRILVVIRDWGNQSISLKPPSFYASTIVGGKKGLEGCCPDLEKQGN